jgi:MerR family transcriptional regulator, redox-sensitive transcriptional activator SoxR
MKELTIGEVARRAGFQPSAIRYYESAGVLPAPERINGRRRYDSSMLQRLAAIQVARQAGFSIGDMRTLFQGFVEATPVSARWQALANKKLAELDALISQAQGMKRLLEQGLRCRCLRLEDCKLLGFGDDN